MMRLPVLRTKRLVLRRPRLSDAEDLVALLNDKAVRAFIPDMPAPYERRDALQWLRRAQGPPRPTPTGPSHPRHIEMDGRMVGGISLRWNAPNKSGDIGYWIGRPYRGQGIATEAARALVDHAFSSLGAQRLWAMAVVENQASREVLESCGMRLEGIQRSHQIIGRRRVDLAIYAILRSDRRPHR